MARHLRLVGAGDNAETLDTLQQLLDDARAGRITGFAYVALKTHGRYSADIVGSANSHPLLAAGIAAALKDQIFHPKG